MMRETRRSTLCTLFALLFLLSSAAPVVGQAPSGSSVGLGLAWGSMCAAGECIEHVNGGAAGFRAGRPLGDRFAADATAVYWYGSSQDETIQRVSLYLTGRLWPSRSAPAFVKLGGGVSWATGGGSGDLAGVVGVGWEIRDWLGVVITPFLDASLFGPPEPLPSLRLISAGFEVGWRL